MNESNNFNIIKFCTDCKTTKTPLWRGGPAGPKVIHTSSSFSFCNIHFAPSWFDSFLDLGLWFLFFLGSFIWFLVVGWWCLFLFLFQSLCNACGIRYRKKKRVFESLNRRRPEKRKDKTTIPGASAKSAFAKVDNDNSYKGLSESFKMRLLVLGKEMMLQRPSSSSTPPFAVVKKKQRCQRRRKLKEEEQAAFSLMALSCGFVFAWLISS